MANIKSAEKRARQAIKRRQHNIALKSRMRTAIKRVRTAIDAGDADKAAELYAAAVPQIDAIAGKGLFHKNMASRNKSRLNKAIKALHQR